MDQISYSKDGFQKLPHDFIPDLNRGNLVRFTSEPEKFSVLYNINFRKDTGRPWDLLTFKNLRNEQIGFIQYVFDDEMLFVQDKKIEDDNYKKKGLTTVGLSLLSIYSQEEYGVERIEGKIRTHNIGSYRSRLLTRNPRTNNYWPSFLDDDDGTRVITYLTEDERILRGIKFKRLHL